MKTLLSMMLFLCGAFAPGFATSDTGGAPLYPETHGYDDIHKAIAQSRQDAIDQGKLLMVIMGADWCHDSRAFITHLQDPAFETLIDERYVVKRVNVGYYDFIREVIAPWNIPVIYGTPTVLVVEPVTDTLLNRDTLPTWRNAASMSADDAVNYFAEYDPGPPAAAQAPSPALAEALAQIDAFEREQAERIYTAYAEIGAMLREMGDESPSPEFRVKWDQLATMRRDITVDLGRMRTEAQARVAAGETDIPFDFPDYSLFID